MARKPKPVPPKSRSTPQKSEKGSAKSKPTPSSKGTPRDEKPSLGEVPISPQILALSKNFNESDVTTYEEGATPSQWAFNKIPPYLVPFVRDPTFENLQQILAHEGAGWWYYSHPIVIEQIRYLLSIPKWCEEDWTEMGWTYQEYDGVSFPTLDSKYLDLINRALQSLIETQAKGLLPGYCITWKAVLKSGRPISVPYHGDGDDTTKNAKIMFKDITEFKGYIDEKIGKRLKKWPRKLDASTVKEITKIIKEGLNRFSSTSPSLPSKRCHILPNPLNENRPPDSREWYASLDFWDIDYTALLEDVTKEINQYRDTGKKTVVLRDGNPACFTYILWGYIYDQPPSRIRDFYNRNRPSK